jgi:hypothetical protein
MMIAFTYLPSFVTMVFRGMPNVWRGRHRLILCWLVFMQAVHPGRKTLEEMAKWTPAAITAWRFGRLLTAAYWGMFGIRVKRSHKDASRVWARTRLTIAPTTERLTHPAKAV